MVKWLYIELFMQQKSFSINGAFYSIQTDEGKKTIFACVSCHPFVCYSHFVQEKSTLTVPIEGRKKRNGRPNETTFKYVYYNP